MQRNLIELHESIAKEMKILQNRVRNLIGSTHWQTDGEHKEAILRKIIRTHIPELFRVCHGFVCYPYEVRLQNENISHHTSTQLDILITKRSKPTLFKDGELVIVTPDVVSQIIEVKTNLDNLNVSLDDVLNKLANEKERIYSFGNKNCKIGLFIFDESRVSDERVLSSLKNVANKRIERTIDWMAIGPNRFFRFWTNGSEEVRSPIQGPVWHSYQLTNLAHAYFVGNVDIEVNGGLSYELQRAWFPVPGTKELRRNWYVPLINGEPKRF